MSVCGGIAKKQSTMHRQNCTIQPTSINDNKLSTNFLFCAEVDNKCEVATKIDPHPRGLKME